MDPDQQLLTSLLHDINWGSLDHASREPQLMSCNIHIHVGVCVCIQRTCVRVHVDITLACLVLCTIRIPFQL